jgi:hypothetical protein
VAFRYSPKKRIRKRIGHRQLYTRVSIDDIVVPWTAEESAAEVAEKPAARTAKKRSGAKPAAKPKPAPAKEKPSASRGKEAKAGKSKK